MKYIKLYENSERFPELKYKAGDYVLIKKWNYPYNYCYIESNDHSEVPYNITWALKEDGNSNVWVKEKEIERLLTPEEIEIYKELKTTYKFNI